MKSELKIFLDEAVWDGKVFTGHWVEGTSTHTIVEPATGGPLTRVGWASCQQVAESAASAAAAQRRWVGMPHHERQEPRLPLREAVIHDGLGAGG